MKNTKLSRKRMADNYETALAGVNADIASRMAVGRWTSRAVTIESAYPEVLIKAEDGPRDEARALRAVPQGGLACCSGSVGRCSPGCC